MRALSAVLVALLTAALASPASAAVRDDTRYVDPRLPESFVRRGGLLVVS